MTSYGHTHRNTDHTTSSIGIGRIFMLCGPKVHFIVDSHRLLTSYSLCLCWRIVVVLAGKSTDAPTVAVPEAVALNGEAQHLDGLSAGPSHVEV